MMTRDAIDVAELVAGPAEGRSRSRPMIWHPMMGFAKSSTHPTDWHVTRESVRAVEFIIGRPKADPPAFDDRIRQPCWVPGQGGISL